MEVPLSTVPSLMQGLYPSTNNSMIRGSGILTWLSAKAGLIKCSKHTATISFQIKDFCDSGVTDLNTVLRVGFRLSFHAIPNTTNPKEEWIANYVTPVIEETITEGGPELNLEEAFWSSDMDKTHPVKGGKDTYSLELEIRALTFLLQIFQKGSGTVHYITLSNLHSRISNLCEPELVRYIGSSSMKRRSFIEERLYIFNLTRLGENDIISLQAPEIYLTVTQLAQFLLKHGGVTSSDMLFRFFQTSPSIPPAIRDRIQNKRAHFMQFLAQHPFVFAPFPAQFYVGVRRNLPFFDYSAFVRKPLQSFPNFQSFTSTRSHSRPVLQSNDSFDQSSLPSPLVEGIASSLNTAGGAVHPLSITNGSRYGAPPTLVNGGQQQQQQQQQHGMGAGHAHLGGVGGGTAAAAVGCPTTIPPTVMPPHHLHVQQQLNTVAAINNHHHHQLGAASTGTQQQQQQQQQINHHHHSHHHHLHHHHGSAGALSSMMNATTPTAGGGAAGAVSPSLVAVGTGGSNAHQQQQVHHHHLVPAQSMPFMAQQQQSQQQQPHHQQQQSQGGSGVAGGFGGGGPSLLSSAGNGIGGGGPTSASALGAQQQQKPLFTLFDIKIDDNQLPSAVHQNGVGTAGATASTLRSATTAPTTVAPSLNSVVPTNGGGVGGAGVASLRGGGGVTNNNNNGTINCNNSASCNSGTGGGGRVVTPTNAIGGGNNIWTYGPHWDIELLKLSDMSSAFSNCTIGNGGGAGAAASSVGTPCATNSTALDSAMSPPLILMNGNRKREFVECAVQTDESSFAITDNETSKQKQKCLLLLLPLGM